MYQNFYKEYKSNRDYMLDYEKTAVKFLGLVTAIILAYIVYSITM